MATVDALQPEAGPSTGRSRTRSKSPSANGHLVHPDVRPAEPIQQSRLILPAWDIPPLKRVHPSHDLISLLNLAPLYDTYIRPYTEPISAKPEPNEAGTGADGADAEGADAGSGEDDEAGAGGKVLTAGSGPGGPGANRGKKRNKGKKGKRLEKGYVGLLEDVIDPSPQGNKPDAGHLLLALIPDMAHPPSGPPPPSIWPEEITVLSEELLQVAKLQAGHKQEGYLRGEKMGVRDAEAKRQRKKARQSQSVAPPTIAIGTPTPGTPTPGTPLLPVAPPQRSAGLGGINATSSTAASSGPVRPFPGRQPPSSAGLPARPVEPGSQALHPGQKRKGGPGGGSRSASPMVHGGAPHAPQQESRPPKQGDRARTEGY